MSELLYPVVVSGRTVRVDLDYPRLNHHANEVEVGLVDVRAADAVRISYDFERDGWVVKQASVFEWAIEDDEMDADWQEVAFIEAWGRENAPIGGSHAR